MGDSLGSRQDNQKNTHKLIVDGGEQRVATRVDDPETHDKLDQVITALGGSSSNDTTANVINIAVVLANTEQNFALPSNCKGFLIRSRQVCNMQIYYTTGSASYFTVPRGGFFDDFNFYLSQTIYFKVDRANTDIEIITYV